MTARAARLHRSPSALRKPSLHAIRHIMTAALLAFTTLSPLHADILWKHPAESLAKNGTPAVDILNGAIPPRDDTSSGTLYFKFRVDPLADILQETERSGTYLAGLVFSQGDTEKLGIGNAPDAWGYSAFCPTFNFPGNKPREITLRTSTPESVGASPYRAPRRGLLTTFVVRIDYIPGANDRVTIWLEPDLKMGSTEMSQPDGLVTRVDADASFDQLRLVHRGVGGGWKFDDLAIATSFEDFVPLPWWRHPWFMAVAVLAGIGLVVAAVVAMERRRARRQLLLMERVQAVAAERVRIAQDLHDDLGAKVTEIVLMGELAKTVRDNPREERSQMDAILGELRQLHASLDEAVWSINPRHDSLVELVEFVSEFAGRFLRHAPVEFHLEAAKQMPDVELSSTLRHNFLLAVKEALNNAVRHARATTIRLRIGVADGQLFASVTDDGCGMNEAAVSSGDGLRNLRARLESIGGSTTFRSAPGAGTEVTFRLPLPAGNSKVAPAPPSR